MGTRAPKKTERKRVNPKPGKARTMNTTMNTEESLRQALRDAWAEEERLGPDFMRAAAEGSREEYCEKERLYFAACNKLSELSQRLAALNPIYTPLVSDKARLEPSSIWKDVWTGRTIKPVPREDYIKEELRKWKATRPSVGSDAAEALLGDYKTKLLAVEYEFMMSGGGKLK